MLFPNRMDDGDERCFGFYDGTSATGRGSEQGQKNLSPVGTKVPRCGSVGLVLRNPKSINLSTRMGPTIKGKESFNQPLDRQGINLGPDSPQALSAMCAAKDFLDPYRRWIHSLVLFGSYAFGRAERGSDLDLLVILKHGHMTKEIKRRLFGVGFDVSTRSSETGGAEVQLVAFNEEEIEHLFRLATPLAHAIREGIIIWDDGFYNPLLARRYPKWPTKEAAEEALVHWIIGQYYLCAIDLKREIHRDHGPGGICSEGKECVGHFKGDILARVISRMLYVTLPELGLLPLTKHDLKEMAVEVYGKGSEKAITLALEVLREDRAIDDTLFHIMFPFARRLFRDCIRVCGKRNRRVIEALRRNAAIYKNLVTPTHGRAF
jgi:predicted nucleotidyltransferase